MNNKFNKSNKFNKFNNFGSNMLNPDKFDS